MIPALRLRRIAGLGGGFGAPSPLLTGLIHHWKLDETSGNRVATVGGLDMAVYNTVGYDVGILGNCATFAGASNALRNVGGRISLAVTGATVAGWIKLANTDRAAILSSNNMTFDWQLVHYGSGSWRFYVFDSVSGNSVAIDTTASSLDAWHFVCGRYNASTKKAEISVDGSAWALGSALSNEPIAASGDPYINRSGGSYGTCAIDSVSVWSRYLSDAEVVSLRNGGAGLEYPFDGSAPIEGTEWYDGAEWYVEP